MATLRTFNPELIRGYIEGTEALEKGIAYMKAVSPGVSDAVAKESAIRYAQETCQRRWLSDTTGYLDSEYRVWSEFAEDVDKGRHFNVVSANCNVSGRDWFMFIICVVFGALGAHRFLSGAKLSGFLWLCTGGLFLVGWIVDCIKIWKDEFDPTW